MKVNGKKTAVVCLSGAQSYEARSHFVSSSGDVINSVKEMRALGYQISSRPGAHAHVDALCKRIKKKYWVLYHLKKAGFSEEDLARVYRTCLLPVLDYCSVMYHSILTDEQDQRVERLQAWGIEMHMWV